MGVTMFTDGSGETGKAIVTWKEEGEWQTLEGYESGLPQVVGRTMGCSYSFTTLSPDSSKCGNWFCIHS